MRNSRFGLWAVALTAILSAAVLFPAPAQATPTDPTTVVLTDDASSPAHVVTCHIFPYTPELTPGGVEAGGYINCDGILDYRYVKFILWRCFVGTANCFNQGEIGWSSPEPAQKEVEALFACSAGTYTYHTQAIFEGFHGNWMYGQKDSPDRTITC